jgi:signal transduction histidine kinase
MSPVPRNSLWRYSRGLGPPVLLWGLFIGYLFFFHEFPFGVSESSDEAALREWLRETRIFSKTLPRLVREYMSWAQTAQPDNEMDPLAPTNWPSELRAFLQSMCEPTKKYQGQLPFFPVIYRIELKFLDRPRPDVPPVIFWDSGVPRNSSQYRSLPNYHIHPNVVVNLDYQLHAFNKRYRDERTASLRVRWVTGLAAAATALAFLWIYVVQRREKEREAHRTRAQQQIDQAERLLLTEELRRQEAEQRKEESERKLLEQRLAAQESEQQLLELKSQLFANIGIMAGSYAHNIKNLLVRPNDLLRRCLEADSISDTQQQMLGEVKQTLGMVTERLQQILHTVRRDPSRAELTRIDLNALAIDLQRTWEHLALEKWKLNLRVEPALEPLAIEGDLSHLQQAAENLLFNARDATFEMRTHLRESARKGSDGGDLPNELEERRQALIAAAAWKGLVVLRTRQEGSRAILEVQDNGIGMTEEVRRQCTQTHFSTKRNNAIYEGYSAGMGLGLSFVVVVLQHQQAAMSIESVPLGGTTFRISFPLAKAV